MVFGNIRDLKDYSWLEEEVLKCFKYAQEHDLMAYEKGSHEIDGDDLFVNIVEYETTTPQNRFWEAHRQYLDLHFMLSRKNLWRKMIFFRWKVNRTAMWS